jgi:myo-inositol-1(or 4)-monophosphatase
MTPQVSPEVETAAAAADASGAILRRYFRSAITADAKADDSPVTIADREAEQAMRAVLSARFPDHDILGEEFGQARSGADFCWVLDPLDGTRAFITGRPTFGTLIDQPVTGERWIGAAGHRTAFSGPFGGVAGTRACAALERAELSCTSPDMLGERRPRWQQLAERVRRVSWGGDCYAYGMLALGHIDIVAECNMNLWDFAALVPIVEGAGGRITDWCGHALGPGSDGTVLAAGSADLHALAVARLNQGRSVLDRK